VLNRYPRGRRSSEQGQALILALAFVAFFGLVIGSILNLGDVTALQHGVTEATASKDSLAEGGAALAAADAGNPNVILTCAPGNSGSLTMQHGDTVRYDVNACNPGKTHALGSDLGKNCLLCILNLVPGSPSTSVLDMRCGGDCSALTTSGGNDYINGSITQGLLAATPDAAQIEIPIGATFDANCCDPIPVQYAPAISGPLSNPAPTLNNPRGGCPSPSWNPNLGCTEQFSTPGDHTVNPGLWHSLTITNDEAHVTMTSGVYVFTSGLSIGQGAVTGNYVTIYLACSSYGSSAQPCPTAGSTGGFINFAGRRSTTITGPAPGQLDTIAADPHLLDPSGATACRQSGTGCLYRDGSGASITGTVDTRSGGVSIVGDGGGRINSGRLITNSLYINVLGDVGSGLTLSGPATTSTDACGVFDDTVTGTRGATTSGGRAIVQSHCSGSSGVVAFNYTTP
jgi:hypothetical protein